MLSLMDRFTDEEFKEIVEQSFSYREVLSRLGYNSNSGDSTARLKEKINKLGISTEHFVTTSPTVRTEENIFIENSTATQKTLRLWYRKGKYTPYVCSICGQEPTWQGKELTLILDHINGVNNDDRLDNLRWVCPNCNQQLETTNGKNKIRREYKIYTCLDCGKQISRGATRCPECYSKYRTSETVKEVSRDELKKLIRTTPFTKIGTMYGVSDNAIRKWCDKYGLPRKASDIKAISNEDWETI